jgi:hypothetical protein
MSDKYIEGLDKFHTHLKRSHIVMEKFGKQAGDISLKLAVLTRFVNKDHPDGANEIARLKQLHEDLWDSLTDVAELFDLFKADVVELVESHKDDFQNIIDMAKKKG